MTSSKIVAVGSRTSPLALAQTDEILLPLRSLHPDVDFAVVPISTGGDRNKDAPLLSMERGMFVKEIDLALLNGEIDIAVHSAKDVPSSLPDGLKIAAFGQRQDARDVLVNRWGRSLLDLPPGARIGTGSPRRTAQLKAVRPDIEVLSIRGNVGTRLQKALGDDYDGIVVAAAGVLRLGRQGEITEYLSPDVCTPDAGQGALVVETRASAHKIMEMLSAVGHRPTSVAVRAERSFVEAVAGGCTAPVGAYAQLNGDFLNVLAMAAVPDGSRIVRVQERYDARDPESAGRQIAEALMRAGAGEITSTGASR